MARALTKEEFRQKYNALPPEKRGEYKKWYKKNVGYFRGKPTMFEKFKDYVLKPSETSRTGTKLFGWDLLPKSGIPFLPAPSPALREKVEADLFLGAQGYQLGATFEQSGVLKDWLVGKFDPESKFLKTTAGAREQALERGGSLAAEGVGRFAGWFNPYGKIVQGMGWLGKLKNLRWMNHPYVKESLSFATMLGLDTALRPHDPDGSILAKWIESEAQLPSALDPLGLVEKGRQRLDPVPDWAKSKTYQIAESVMTGGILGLMFKGGIDYLAKPLFGTIIPSGVNKLFDRIPSLRNAYVQGVVIPGAGVRLPGLQQAFSKPQEVAMLAKERMAAGGTQRQAVRERILEFDTMPQQWGYKDWLDLRTKHPKINDFIFDYMRGKPVGSRTLRSQFPDYDQRAGEQLAQLLRGVGEQHARIGKNAISEALINPDKAKSAAALAFNRLRGMKNTINTNMVELRKLKRPDGSPLLTKETADIYTDAYVHHIFKNKSEVQRLLGAAAAKGGGGSSLSLPEIRMRRDYPQVSIKGGGVDIVVQIQPGRENLITKRMIEPPRGAIVGTEPLTTIPGDVPWLMREAEATLQAAKKQFPRAEVTLTKALTKAEYAELGLITDPSFAIPATMAHQRSIIDNWKILESFKKNTNMVAAKPKYDFWTKLEGREYGPLENMYADPRLATELVSGYNALTPVFQGYVDAMSLWRAVNVVTNPSTQFRNLLSNTVFAYLQGHNPVAQSKHFMRGTDATIQFLFRGKENVLGKELVKGRVFSSEFVRGELQAIEMEGLQATLKAFQRGEAEAGMNLFRQWGEKIYASPAGKAYSAGDLVWKAFSFSIYRAEGMSIKQAARRVLNTYPDYSRVPKLLQANVPFSWKNNPIVGSPFVAFTHETVRIYANAALENPVRFMSVMALPHFIRRTAQYNLGLTDNEMVELERNSPEWRMRGYNTPLVPFRSPDGELLTFDLSYILPLGDVANAFPLFHQTYLKLAYDTDFPDDPTARAPAESLSPLFPVFTNPFMRTGIEQLSGRSLFTGRDYFKVSRDEAPQEYWREVGEGWFKTLLPSWASVPIPITTETGEHMLFEETGVKKLRQALTEESPSPWNPNIRRNVPLTVADVALGVKFQQISPVNDMIAKHRSINRMLRKRQTIVGRYPASHQRESWEEDIAAMEIQQDRLWRRIYLLAANADDAPPDIVDWLKKNQPKEKK